MLRWRGKSIRRNATATTTRLLLLLLLLLLVSCQQRRHDRNVDDAPVNEEIPLSSVVFRAVALGTSPLPPSGSALLWDPNSALWLMIEISRSMCVQVAFSFACHETAKIVNVAHYVFAQSPTVCRGIYLLADWNYDIKRFFAYFKACKHAPNRRIHNCQSGIGNCLYVI